MNFSVLFNNVVGALLLPPLNFALLCALGLVLRRRWPRLGLGIGALGLLALVIFSTQAGARLLLAPLERLAPPLQHEQAAATQAIVVLGGGRIEQAPEYDGQDVPALVAQLRVRYAARLHRETGLPVLFSGGAPDVAAESEAAVMARMLERDYGLPTRWLEEGSHNTAQNAHRSAAILLPQGLRRILLVTDATHMARSRAIFESAGFEVVPAATAYFSHIPLRALDFVPNGEGFRRSHYAMHEWVGLLWYRLRYH